jgi:hypothetical protein
MLCLRRYEFRGLYRPETIFKSYDFRVTTDCSGLISFFPVQKQPKKEIGVLILLLWESCPVDAVHGRHGVHGAPAGAAPAAVTAITAPAVGPCLPSGRDVRGGSQRSRSTAVGPCPPYGRDNREGSRRSRPARRSRVTGGTAPLATVRSGRTGPSKTIPAITALTAITPVTAVTAWSRR